MRIVCDERKGLCIKLESNEKKRQVTLSDITNNLLSNLISVYVSQTTEENREALYGQLSLAFSNTLGYYAPDLYFPSEEESEKFAKAIELLASEAPDNTEEIEEAKRLVKERIKESDGVYADVTGEFVECTEEEYNKLKEDNE